MWDAYNMFVDLKKKKGDNNNNYVYVYSYVDDAVTIIYMDRLLYVDRSYKLI